MDASIVQAARGYNNTRTVNQTSAPSAAGVVSDFAAVLGDSEAKARQAMTTGADPHALVQALAETQLAVQTAASVRDKVVEAYQEILRMPI